jgi:hypothetical protein
MGNDRPTKHASILAVLIAIALAPGMAWAGDPGVPGMTGTDLSAGYAPPMPPTTSWPSGISGPAIAGCSYTFPIWVVYQCPATIANQPGSRVVYLSINPRAGLLGGQPYLYHP